MNIINRFLDWFSHYHDYMCEIDLGGIYLINPYGRTPFYSYKTKLTDVVPLPDYALKWEPSTPPYMNDISDKLE